MSIIDFHVHIFPDKIAQKAANAVGRFYDIPMAMDGSLSTAIREMDRAGIGRFVAHSVATTPAQVHSINKFIMEAYAQYPERIIPFAAMHPDAENIPQLIDEIVAADFNADLIVLACGEGMGAVYKLPSVHSVIGNVPVDTVVRPARYTVCRALANYRIAGLFSLSGNFYRQIPTVNDDLTVAYITDEIVIRILVLTKWRAPRAFVAYALEDMSVMLCSCIFKRIFQRLIILEILIIMLCRESNVPGPHLVASFIGDDTANIDLVTASIGGNNEIEVGFIKDLLR